MTEDHDLNLCEEVLLQEQTSSTLIKKKKKKNETAWEGKCPRIKAPTESYGTSRQNLEKEMEIQEKENLVKKERKEVQMLLNTSRTNLS